MENKFLVGVIVSVLVVILYIALVSIYSYSFMVLINIVLNHYDIKTIDFKSSFALVVLASTFFIAKIGNSK